MTKLISWQEKRRGEKRTGKVSENKVRQIQYWKRTKEASNNSISFSRRVVALKVVTG